MKPRKSAPKKHLNELLALLLIAVVLAAMVALGLFYGVGSAPTGVVVTPEPTASRMSQLCQQKLLDHLDKGGVDLQAEMTYGDLQGCDFSSEIEQSQQGRTSRSWSSSLK